MSNIELINWVDTTCSVCKVSLDVLFEFRHPYPVRGWKFCIVYYMQCPECNKLYIGEYSEGKVNGKCWSMSPVDRVHQLEGFIGEAYWAYHEEPIEEVSDGCI